MLPDGICAKVKKDSYEVPAIFKLLQSAGKIEERIMYNTYNMGIGMVIAVDPDDADKAVKALEAAGENAYIIGEAAASDKKETVLC